MNGQAPNSILTRRMNRWLIWPLYCGLWIILFTRTVSAAQDYYINNFIATVPGNTGNIDATNFINNGSFTVNSSFLYETTDTRNYTNNGLMVAVIGFRFDTLAGGSRSMASSFDNENTIRCGSAQDGGGFLVGSGLNSLNTLPQLIVNATNILNHGTLDVGVNGLIQLTGQNLDLSYGSTTLEQGGSINSSFGIIGTGDFGANTNQNWDPSVKLTATSATSSDPYVFSLFNSQSYFNTNSTDPSNVVIRAVFISNPYPNVTNQIYFQASDAGNAHVEWDGIYINPATGQTITNYLYLSDDYVLGASTNVSLRNNGIPSNFTFSKVGPDLTLTNPFASTFPVGLFPSGAITNPFSYTEAEFAATSVIPGPSDTNPSGALTNLPSRIQISASRELNLALTTISGQNYLSLTCTNQFNGNVGAQIVSPYSDINLGVTNGFLAVSNLLQSVIPAWVGSVQAWSTRWFYTDTNSGINYDFRVMIVDSEIYPYTAPLVQNLTLHGTNLVISDTFNVLSNLSIDAQSLTLTTNGLGAGSLKGELNLESGSIFVPSSLPNLKYLTNNGVISTLNLAVFGSAPPNSYQSFVNGGSIVNYGGTTIWSSDFQNSGTIFSGAGSFALQSLTGEISGGEIDAAGDISFTTGSLVVSNLFMPDGRSLILTVTNLLTDGGPPNANQWSANGTSGIGLQLPIRPATGDLLGTSISIFTPTNVNKNVINTWASEDRGISISGYTNNVAVGQLYLDPRKPAPFGLLTFKGAGISNAIYVDKLIFADYATNLDLVYSNVTSLAINSNLVIYYAQAVVQGASNQVSIAEKINHWNTNHLRWVPAYAGYYSSTNVVFGGTTNLINTALRLSPDIDSNGNGIVNLNDPNPVDFSSFPTQVNLTLTTTNVPPRSAELQWMVLPSATSPLISSVYYTTNLAAGGWTTLTNIYTQPSTSTNVLLDVLSPLVPHYYRVSVQPWLTYPYNP